MTAEKEFLNVIGVVMKVMCKHFRIMPIKHAERREFDIEYRSTGAPHKWGLEKRTLSSYLKKASFLSRNPKNVPVKAITISTKTQ